MKKTRKQVLRFGVIGVLNTAIDTLLFALLIGMSPWLAQHFLWASFIAFIAASLHSYIWNSLWTFSVGRVMHFRQFLTFYASTIGALIANQVLLWILVELGAPEIPSKAVAGITAGLLNFGVQKLWVFGQSNRIEPKSETTYTDSNNV